MKVTPGILQGALRELSWRGLQDRKGDRNTVRQMADPRLNRIYIKRI